MYFSSRLGIFHPDLVKVVIGSRSSSHSSYPVKTHVHTIHTSRSDSLVMQSPELSEGPVLETFPLKLELDDSTQMTSGILKVL